MKSLALLLFTVLAASAATITGNVKDTRLAPTVTNVLFAPLSTPMASAPSVIFSRAQTVLTDTNGDFALTLAPGNYKVTIGSNALDSFIISVPAGDGTNAWTDLATGVLTYQYPFSPAYVDRIIATAKGDLYVFDGTNVARLGAGAAGTVLSSDAAAATGLRWSALHELAPPAWVQRVVAEHTAYTNLAGVIIPADDSVPQSNEGVQTVTATITPRGASNCLHVSFSGMVSSSGTLLATAALFRDDETGALAAAGDTVTTAQARRLALTARVPCGSTNAQTFKIRIGLANSATLYLNGNAGGRLYGGLAAHRLIITETRE